MSADVFDTNSHFPICCLIELDEWLESEKRHDKWQHLGSIACPIDSPSLLPLQPSWLLCSLHTGAHTHVQACMYIFANTYTHCIMLLEVVEFFWSGKTNKGFHWLRMTVSVLLNALSGVSAEHQTLTTSLRTAIQFMWSENHILHLNWLRRRKHHYHQI